MLDQIVQWWRNDPNARVLLRTFVVGVLTYITSSIAAGDAFTDWRSFLYAALAAGANQALGILSPTEPLIGVKFAVHAPKALVDAIAHPEWRDQIGFAHLPLGRLPVKRDSRTLLLGRYLNHAKLPAIPAVYSLLRAVAKWPMYGNDRLGDCTCAAIGHMIQAWTFALGAGVTLTDKVVETFYWLTGKPSRRTGEAGGPTDTGRVELDILNTWRKKGIGGHKITAFAAVEPTSEAMVRAATFLFGGLYLGLALPLTAQSQQVWDVVGDGRTGNSAPGSWGGHAVDVVAYDDEHLTIITWGGPLKITWRFLATYCEEAYAILAPEWLNARGESLAGFDEQQLLADLQTVTA